MQPQQQPPQPQYVHQAAAPVQQTLSSAHTLQTMDKIGDILSAATGASPAPAGTMMIGPDVQNIVDQSEAFESVAQVKRVILSRHTVVS